MTEAVQGADVQIQHAAHEMTIPDVGEREVVVPYATIGEPKDLLLTGLGEIEVLEIAGRLADRGVTGLAVASLVYPPVGKKQFSGIVEASIVGGAEALADAIAGEGRPLDRAFGVSEGGSQLLLAAHQNSGRYSELVAIAPGCLNVAALGDTPKQQTRTLQDRFKEAGLIDLIAKVKDVRVLELITEMRGGLEYAAGQNPTEIVSKLAGKLEIYIGEQDTIFPYTEGVEAVGEDSITLFPEMGHPTLLSEAGCDDVAGIINATYTGGLAL